MSITILYYKLNSFLLYYYYYYHIRLYTILVILLVSECLGVRPGSGLLSGVPGRRHCGGPLARVEKKHGVTNCDGCEVKITENN